MNITHLSLLKFSTNILEAGAVPPCDRVLVMWVEIDVAVPLFPLCGPLTRKCL